MKALYIIIFACLCCFSAANAQSGSTLANDEVVKNPEINQSDVRKEIRIPDIKGYQTLKCDLHMHTVFSDGQLWPSLRVKEAWQQGLDAIAITDHTNRKPATATSKAPCDYFKIDLNQSNQIAQSQASAYDMIVIPGAELSPGKPPGHMNALFITDANVFDTKDSVLAIELAVKQGAFILWNHPGWPDDNTKIYPIHEKWLKEKKIHGIEVFNEKEYYPRSFDWCRDMNLAFVGNTDIHHIVEGLYSIPIRPMTLVFASERTTEGIKEALFAQRSVALFDNMLAGPKDYLLALVEASLKVKIINKENRTVFVTNNSDITYKMTDGEKLYIFQAGKTTRVKLPATGNLKVLNCFTGMNENLIFNFSL